VPPARRKRLYQIVVSRVRDPAFLDFLLRLK
jgi:hypothetical protein